MDNPRVERARMLMQRGMMDRAIQELAEHLGQAPDDAEAFALLAMCEADRKNPELAEQHARRAQALAPDHPFPHFALACVKQTQERFTEALAAIDDALRLSPGDAYFHATRGQILFLLEKWKAALASSDRALAIDPEEQLALNVKALAARNLGWREVTAEQIRTALSNDPEDEGTHLVAGWSCLDRGDRDQAAVHFQEALRLDPNCESAREGMLEALRARNPLYRGMHRFFLWMDRMSTRAGLGLMLGAYILYRLLRFLAQSYPALAPFVLPFVFLYIAFVLATWYSRPLANLPLLFHPWGRLALNRRERAGAIITVVLLGLTAISAIVALLTPSILVFNVAFGAAFLFGGCSIPLAMTFDLPSAKQRRMMACYSAVIICLGLVWLAIEFAYISAAGDKEQLKSAAGTMFYIYLMGAALSAWAVFLMGFLARPR